MRYVQKLSHDAFRLSHVVTKNFSLAVYVPLGSVATDNSELLVVRSRSFHCLLQSGSDSFSIVRMHGFDKEIIAGLGFAGLVPEDAMMLVRPVRLTCLDVPLPTSRDS